ncbi:hypothetical protein [Aureibacter tunicatorum]|uniref:Uncharacterized protein n=1 Tax=Aureibacter tunicatorum TaxID=866807 RepID=A0AAE3XHV5_9BACT|nr:hypothetical protein [Aureibacter tunicatorum]MDR6237138.1 hypothetical protein [Aureibacter tunicatorum]BDD06130.1 hypothetical protein AUTU_36130 [Aureibacter tunicatorum]
MTIENVVSNILEGLALAQYESYKFSADKHASIKDRLFPIPVAEVKEVTLDFCYAYQEGYDAPQIKAVDYVRIYHAIEDEAEAHIDNIFTHIETHVRNNSSIGSEVEKDEIIARLKDGRFVQPILGLFETKFVNALKLNLDPTSIPVSLLQDIGTYTLLEESVTEVLLDDDKIKPVYESTGFGSIYLNMGDRANAFKLNVNTIIYKGMSITLDENKLQELPDSSIQKAKLVLSLKNVSSKNNSDSAA